MSNQELASSHPCAYPSVDGAAMVAVEDEIEDDVSKSRDEITISQMETRL